MGQCWRRALARAGAGYFCGKWMLYWPSGNWEENQSESPSLAAMLMARSVFHGFWHADFHPPEGRTHGRAGQSPSVA
eukprot:826038-Amphidinium_carterae.1